MPTDFIRYDILDGSIAAQEWINLTMFPFEMHFLVDLSFMWAKYYSITELEAEC